VHSRVEWNNDSSQDCGTKIWVGVTSLEHRNDVFKTALSVIQRILLVRLRCVLPCTRLSVG
jgi:hypothetical protein